MKWQTEKKIHWNAEASIPFALATFNQHLQKSEEWEKKNRKLGYSPSHQWIARQAQQNRFKQGKKCCQSAVSVRQRVCVLSELNDSENAETNSSIALQTFRKCTQIDFELIFFLLLLLYLGFRLYMSRICIYWFSGVCKM